MSLFSSLQHKGPFSQHQFLPYRSCSLRQADERAAGLERKLEEQRAEHEQAAATAAGQLETVKQELAGARTQCARLEDRASALKEQLKTAKAEAAQRAKALEKANAEAALESARESLQEARAGEKAAREQLTALQAENARLQARVKGGGKRG